MIAEGERRRALPAGRSHDANIASCFKDGAGVTKGRAPSTPPDTIPIESPSLQSLLLTSRARGQKLSTATGFIVFAADVPLLITNRHVVTGRNNDDGSLLHPSAAVPDEIEILYMVASNPLTWGSRFERLFDDEGGRRWVEHPRWREKADIIALPLTQTDVFLSPHSLEKPQREVSIRPTDIVSVVGFPYGESTMGAALWATGFVASEPALPFRTLPVFVIDCRTRSGQSGSPVILHRPAGGLVTLASGEAFMNDEPISQLIGVYSARVNKDSDLGYVWKIGVLRELVEFAAGPSSVAGVRQKLREQRNDPTGHR